MALKLARLALGTDLVNWLPGISERPNAPN